jgi:hypothetical protein
VRLAVGLALAVVSTAALSWGFFAQHGAAGGMPALSPRRPLRSLRSLFSSPRWLAGYLAGLAGWGLYVWALGFAPLSLVQATSAGGIGLLALLSSRIRGIRLRSSERGGVLVSLVGLALLGASLGSATGGRATHSAAAPLAWVLSSAALAVAAGASARSLEPGAGLAIAAGLLYSAGDVATKAALSGMAPLFVPLLLACHGLGFAAMQTTLQRGEVLPTVGVASLLMNALPIVAGITVFREQVPTGAAEVARLVSFAAVVVGAALLSRRQAGRSVSPSVGADTSAAMLPSG